MSLKTAYVRGVRVIRSAARSVGLLRSGKSADGSRFKRWFRSLFAIYDLDDMIRLDIPWWTFAAIDEVESFLASRPSARAFEFGSGASTIWLAKRCSHVISVEHDEAWAAFLQDHLKNYPNIDHRFVAPSQALDRSSSDFRSQKTKWTQFDFRNYIEEIDKDDELYDLIVIDGRCREDCLRLASRHLKDAGMIVFDNSNRARYLAAINEMGGSREHFKGLAACLPYFDQTTLIRK